MYSAHCTNIIRISTRVNSKNIGFQFTLISYLFKDISGQIYHIYSRTYLDKNDKSELRNKWYNIVF